MSDSSSRSPLDAPPPDGLDDVFTLPQWVEDEGLRGLYDELVARMRAEAAGMPMNTVQTLLIERIAFNYVVMKYKERNQGTERGFIRASEQKDFNTWWLSMTVEFNRLLMTNADKLRESLLIEINNVLTAGLSQIKDDEERRAVRRHFAEAFAALNL